MCGKIYVINVTVFTCIYIAFCINKSLNLVNIMLFKGRTHLLLNLRVSEGGTSGGYMSYLLTICPGETSTSVLNASASDESAGVDVARKTREIIR